MASNTAMSPCTDDGFLPHCGVEEPVGQRARRRGSWMMHPPSQWPSVRRRPRWQWRQEGSTSSTIQRQKSRLFGEHAVRIHTDPPMSLRRGDEQPVLALVLPFPADRALLSPRLYGSTDISTRMNLAICCTVVYNPCSCLRESTARIQGQLC